MAKADVLDGLRALPKTGPMSVLQTLVVTDVQRQVAALPGLTPTERAQRVTEILQGQEVREFLSAAEPAPSLHAVFGLGVPRHASRL
jgi:hypothetical protein